MFAIIACCSIICIKWNCFTRRHISLCLRYFSAVFFLSTFFVCIYFVFRFFSYTALRYGSGFGIWNDRRHQIRRGSFACIRDILQANDLIMAQTQTEWCKKKPNLNHEEIFEVIFLSWICIVNWRDWLFNDVEVISLTGYLYAIETKILWLLYPIRSECLMKCWNTNENESSRNFFNLQR